MRVWVSLLLIACILLAYPVSGGAGVDARVPVILVHGWGGCGESTWGYPSAKAGSLYARLLGQGYQAADIYSFVPAGPASDYLGLAGELAVMVESTLNVTGADEVDLITHCTGALVARALTGSSAYGGGVDQVIMIEPPNRGSDWVQEWGEKSLLHAQEARRRTESRYRAGHAPIWEIPATTDLDDYLYWRAYYLYEPLYGDYIWSQRLVPGPVLPAPADFAGWFRTQHPDRFQELFYGPPSALGSMPVPGWDRSLPGPASVLDRAYVELLAMEAGRHLYAALVPPVEGLAADWWSDVHPSGDWRETLVRFVVLRASRFIRQVGWPWLGFLVRGVALDYMDGQGAVGEEAIWPGLVPDYVSWPERGYSGSAIRANLVLVGLSENEALSRFWAPGEGPRYSILVTERGMSLPWDDPVLAAPERSTLYLDGGDRVLRFGAGLRTGPWRRDVQLAVVDLLLCRTAVSGISAPWQGRVGNLGPTIIQMGDDGVPVVELRSFPEGYRVVAWRDEGQFVIAAHSGGTAVEGDDRLLLQVVPDSPRVPDWEEILSPVWAEVAVNTHLSGRDPGSGDNPGMVHPDPSPAPPSPGPVEPDPSPDLPGHDPGEGPLIEVIRTSRLTTDKKERRIYHDRWEWELDGTVWDDPVLAVPESSFRAQVGPEPMDVVARSYANDGRLIREISWSVTPADRDLLPEGVSAIEVGDEEWWEFSAHSILEPGVTVHIDGPQSWVTGMPATYHVISDITLPPYVEDADIYYYPDQTFRVMWERPGTFTVLAAVNLRFSYRLPERSLYVSVIYLAELEVEVVATSITR